MKREKQEVRLFTSSDKHKKRKRITLAIEIFVGLLVIIGTFIVFFNPQDFSLSGFRNSIESKISLKKPDTSTKDLSFEEQVKDLIHGKALDVQSVKKAAEGFFIVESFEGTRVIIDPNKELDDQVTTLQTVLSKAKIDKKKAVLIDFRFEKLVVRYDR